MTLILTVATKNFVCMGADRKLTVTDGPNFVHPGTKICRMELNNGKGALGYSGVGAKVSDNSVFEVSEWAKRALVGTKLNVKQAFFRIVHEANRKVVGYRNTQDFLWAGFEDAKPIVYYARIQPQEQGGIDLGCVDVVQYGAVACAIGSGRIYISKPESEKLLARAKSLHDMRESSGEIEKGMARLIKLASENEILAQGSRENLLSPESIITTTIADGTAWAHQYDKNAERVGPACIPTIAGGFDVNAIANAVIKHVGPELDKGLANIIAGIESGMHINVEEINKELKSLPFVPDIRFWESND